MLFKRNKRLLIFVLCITLLCGCSNILSSKNTTLSLNNTKSITIATLPSPPKKKYVTRKTDIKKIIDFVNSMSKKEIPKKNVYGWFISISTLGKEKHDISFAGTNLNIDDKWYEINNNELDKIIKLYKELDYEEDTVN